MVCLQIEDDDMDNDEDDDDAEDADGGDDGRPNGAGRSNPWHRTGSGRGEAAGATGVASKASIHEPPLEGDPLRDAYLSYCDSALECRPPPLLSNKNRPSGSACSLQ